MGFLKSRKLWYAVAGVAGCIVAHVTGKPELRDAVLQLATALIAGHALTDAAAAVRRPQ